MLADIVEGADLAVAAGEHDHALVEDLVGEEAARLAKLVHMPDGVPDLVEDALPFRGEDAGVIEIARGQGTGACRSGD